MSAYGKIKARKGVEQGSVEKEINVGRQSSFEKTLAKGAQSESKAWSEIIGSRNKGRSTPLSDSRWVGVLESLCGYRIEKRGELWLILDPARGKIQ